MLTQDPMHCASVVDRVCGGDGVRSACWDGLDLPRARVLEPCLKSSLGEAAGIGRSRGAATFERAVREAGVVRLARFGTANSVSSELPTWSRRLLTSAFLRTGAPYDTTEAFITLVKLFALVGCRIYSVKTNIVRHDAWVWPPKSCRHSFFVRDVVSFLNCLNDFYR